MTDAVEIISVSRDTRTIVIRERPRSSKQLVEALLQYWKEREMPWDITEVLRFKDPQKIYYSVNWVNKGDDTQ